MTLAPEGTNNSFLHFDTTCLFRQAPYLIVCSGQHTSILKRVPCTAPLSMKACCESSHINRPQHPVEWWHKVKVLQPESRPDVCCQLLHKSEKREREESNQRRSGTCTCRPPWQTKSKS